MRTGRARNIWLALIALAIGNRIFNDLSAWPGALIMVLSVVFLGYNFLKINKDETND